MTMYSRYGKGKAFLVSGRYFAEALFARLDDGDQTHVVLV